MSHAPSAPINFHESLLEFDREARDRIRGSGCRRCGGRLDVSNYPRKVRGLELEEEQAGDYGVRLSLCCSVEGCRARATPPSMRFLGRRVYGAIVFVLASVIATPDSVPAGSVPSHSMSPSRPTRQRWSAWWSTGLLLEPWFADVAARFSMPLDRARMPDDLFERFVGDVLDRCAHVVALLAPATTRSVPPESARAAMVR